MARGWESKSVESQVEDFKSKADQDRAAKLTREQMESSRERSVLLLARARLVHSLESTQNARYREQLDRSLAQVDADLARLSEHPK